MQQSMAFLACSMHTHLEQCGAAETGSRELHRCRRASNVGRLGCSNGKNQDEHHVDTGSAQRAGIDGTLVVVRASVANPCRTGSYIVGLQGHTEPSSRYTFEPHNTIDPLSL